MKEFFDEYLKIVMYTVFGLLMIVSSYSIVLNIRHYNSLSDVIYVSELSVDYKKYRDNITMIENNLNKQDSLDGELSVYLKNMLNVLKKGGIFRLLPNTKITYADLYELNEFFMEEIINNSWISDVRMKLEDKKYDEEINFLISNSKYMRHYLINNGLILRDNGVEDKINEDYEFILKNYRYFSDLILKLSEDIEV